jgi:hypothetical protein
MLSPALATSWRQCTNDDDGNRIADVLGYPDYDGYRKLTDTTSTTDTTGTTGATTSTAGVG